jgi:hypothetical protein
MPLSAARSRLAGYKTKLNRTSSAVAARMPRLDRKGRSQKYVPAFG